MSAARQTLGRWRYHAIVLSLALAVVTAAAVLSMDEEGRVAMPLIGPLPSTCAWQRMLATDCPGCGTTRAFVALAHGDVATAWRMNPASLLLFAALLYQIPFRGIQLWRLSHGRRDHRHGLWTIQIAVWLIIAAMLLQWLVRHGF